MQFEGSPRLDFVNAVCRQCERPACVRACAHTPKAIRKNPKDGVVRVAPELCTGCQECVKACPYNAVAFDFRRQEAEKPDTHFWIDLGKRFGFDDVLRQEYKDSERFWNECMLADLRMKGMTVERLRRNPYNWARGPLPVEDFEEQETLFEEGMVYPGDGRGRRFPTPSGKLEIWTPELEAKFNAVGLSALPEFYSEPGQLIPLPHLERLTSDADEGVPSPFWPGFNADVVRLVSPGPNPPVPFDTKLVTGRPPVPQFHSWTHFWWGAQATGSWWRPSGEPSRRGRGCIPGYEGTSSTCLSAGVSASPTIRGRAPTGSSPRRSGTPLRTRPTSRSRPAVSAKRDGGTRGRLGFEGLEMVC